MAAKKKAPKAEARTFEQSMEDLESLVEAMEEDQLPLEELVANYEKGAGLIHHCEQLLAAAQKRIALIEVGKSVEKNLAPTLKGVEDSSTASGGPNPEAPEDDIRLL